MTGKIKKIADTFSIVLGFIVMGAGILFLVFIENPVRYFFYVLFLAVVINFKSFPNLRIDLKKVAGNFLITLCVAYLSLITLLSLSPFLKIQEFKLSHPGWKPVSAQIIKPTALWDTGYKREGNSYVDVYYEYLSDGKLYKNSASEALYQYYPLWNRKKSHELVNEFSKSVSEKIKKKDYIIFSDPDQPEKSKLFLSTDLFYFQGSLFYNMVTGIAALLLIILGLTAAIFLVPLNRQREGKRK